MLPCFVIFVVQPVVQVIAGNRRGTTLFLPWAGHALTSRCFCCAASISRSFEPVTCQLDRLSRSCQGDPLGCAEGLFPPPAQMGLSAAASLVWGLSARRLLGQLRVKMRPEGGGQLSAPTGHCAPMGNSRASPDLPTILRPCCPEGVDRATAICLHRLAQPGHRSARAVELALRSDSLRRPLSIR